MEVIGATVVIAFVLARGLQRGRPWVARNLHWTGDSYLIHRRVASLTIVGSLVLVLGVAVATRHAASGASPVGAGTALSFHPLPLHVAPTVPPPTTLPQPQVPVSTILAAPRGDIPRFATPGAAAPDGTVGLWYGYSIVLPVLDQQPGWLQVRLPDRPNGSIAWVQSGDVTLSTTPYRLIVSLGAERLRVYQGGFPILDLPVGVGAPATPTVTGAYFITVRVPPPNAAYGPFVLSTSAHSDAITSWEGQGDAIIALHGPIDSYADSRIGTGNARVSNGCIRLHDSDLVKLGMIPAGTPLDITA